MIITNNGKNKLGSGFITCWYIALMATSLLPNCPLVSFTTTGDQIDSEPLRCSHHLVSNFKYQTPKTTNY